MTPQEFNALPDGTSIASMDWANPERYVIKGPTDKFGARQAEDPANPEWGCHCGHRQPRVDGNVPACPQYGSHGGAPMVVRTFSMLPGDVRCTWSGIAGIAQAKAQKDADRKNRETYLKQAVARHVPNAQVMVNDSTSTITVAADQTAAIIAALNK